LNKYILAMPFVREATPEELEEMPIAIVSTVSNLVAPEDLEPPVPSPIPPMPEESSMSAAKYCRLKAQCDAIISTNNAKEAAYKVVREEWELSEAKRLFRGGREAMTLAFEAEERRVREAEEARRKELERVRGQEEGEDEMVSVLSFGFLSTDGSYRTKTTRAWMLV
jgi:hypothetical protein